MPDSMQLLRSQVDSTRTPVGYLGGVFQTNFMSQWTQNQFQKQGEGMQAVCAVYVPEGFVLLVDMGLHNAGWKFVRTGAALELHEVIGSQGNYCWAHELDKLEVINPTSNPNHQQLAEKINSDGANRANSEKLVGILDDLFQLVGIKLYSELDLLMRTLDVSQSAPEYLVGILRATSKEARHLPYWANFLSSVKAELGARKLDVDKILIGLA